MLLGVNEMERKYHASYKDFNNTINENVKSLDDAISNIAYRVEQYRNIEKGLRAAKLIKENPDAKDAFAFACKMEGIRFDV